MDIWGPIFVHSLDGFQYFLTVMDNFIRYTWTFWMHRKSETRTQIYNFVTYCQNQFSDNIKTIRIDYGSEIIMPFYYASLGILHQKISIETPQQSSTIERKHRHLLNVTRSILFHAKLPKRFWSFSL